MKVFFIIIVMQSKRLNLQESYNWQLHHDDIQAATSQLIQDFLPRIRALCFARLIPFNPFLVIPSSFSSWDINERVLNGKPQGQYEECDGVAGPISKRWLQEMFLTTKSLLFWGCGITRLGDGTPTGKLLFFPNVKYSRILNDIGLNS